MKKFITLFIALSFFSCDDGDFDTPEFDFEDTVYSCYDYLLYITNSSKTETMAMTLIDGQLGTEIGEKSYPVSSSLEVVYRLFDGGIGSDYFCQLIPATTPKVLKEMNDVFEEYFGIEDPPARTTFQAGGIIAGAKLEIELTAFIPQ